MRRATAIESGLFDIEADHLGEFRPAREIQPDSREILYAMIGLAARPNVNQDPSSLGIADAALAPAGVPTPARAHGFLRLANLPNYAFGRLSRHEVTLWRQVGQTLFALDTLDRRKPTERKRYPTQHLPPTGVEGWTRRI
jgi:hypothetical protein